MILQWIEKMGIVEKRELLERLKALIAKKMAGSTLAGKPKRYPRRTSADLFCKGHSAQGHHRGKCCFCGRIFLAKMGSALRPPRHIPFCLLPGRWALPRRVACRWRGSGSATASPASCGQNRRSIRSRTASRCSQASWQKAAMYTRGALVNMSQSLWDWWKVRAEVNGGLTES